MEPLLRHEERVRTLQDEMALWQTKKSCEETLSLTSSTHHSNTTHKKSYNNTRAKLDLTPLCNFLTIDKVTKRAIVEPKITMEQLAQKCLEQGFLVPVVPEFKGITVGGAIMGAAGESSSFKYGLFNDICASYDILLGNGDVVRTSPKENSDLFYGIAGSYGSLGTIVKAEIQLVDAPKAIKLSYRCFTNPQKALEYIIAQCQQKDAIEYIDGIVFSNDCAVIMEGSFERSDKIKSSYCDLQSMSAPWFYQHVRDIAGSHESFEEFFHPVEYLFRYDQGAFWMGSYVLKRDFFLRFFFQGLCGFSKKNAYLPFNDNELKNYSDIQQKPSYFRRMIGHFLPSQRLYALLHKNEQWVATKCLIQDCFIPQRSAQDFFSICTKKCQTYPLWLCPIKKTDTQQIFSPHASSCLDPFYINFGIYGLPGTSYAIPDLTRDLENEVVKYNGRKVLYSHSYYAPDQFWKIYREQPYLDLRKKYHAEGTWLRIDQKVLTPD